jgi:hypothetical protein
MTQKDYDFISKNYYNSRIIMSKNSEINFTPIPISKQDKSFKPKGLWYGIGISWIEWVKSNMPEWEYDNIYEIKIDESKIFKINNNKLLKEFTSKYKKPFDHIKNTSFTLIDWKNFCAIKGGIEIDPFISNTLFDIWISTWDVESGCIWDDNVIEKITKII